MKYILLIWVLLIIQVAAFAAGSSAPTRTPTDKLNIRIRQINIQISRDLKAGKLTKDQAKTLRGQVEAVRKQEVADLKLNGTKTLTDAQISQLNEQLNTLSKSIPLK